MSEENIIQWVRIRNKKQEAATDETIKKQDASLDILRRKLATAPPEEKKRWQDLIDAWLDRRLDATSYRKTLKP